MSHPSRPHGLLCTLSSTVLRQAHTLRTGHSAEAAIKSLAPAYSRALHQPSKHRTRGQLLLHQTRPPRVIHLAPPASFARRDLSTADPTSESEFLAKDGRHSPAVGPESIPYSSLIVGVPREIYPNERRVAITPQNVALLLKKGFHRVLVERGAGVLAQFTDLAYKQAGATLVDGATVWNGSDILLKVRAPSIEGSHPEIEHLKDGSTVISMIFPAQNRHTVDLIAKRHATSFAMDMIPRISRAQVFDALSSMANIAGYKAIMEASNHFGRFLVGQTTAAGKIAPSKVLVIGAGVAGLSAIATARRMGAIVRGFDTRAAARDQVESFGAEFLEVPVQEDGSGAGGYGKEMSKELWLQQLKFQEGHLPS
jgi:NAD(P) transhydrogenase